MNLNIGALYDKQNIYVKDKSFLQQSYSALTDVVEKELTPDNFKYVNFFKTEQPVVKPPSWFLPLYEPTLSNSK